VLVNRKDIVSLKTLSSAKELVSVDAIPSTFKSDFQLFFFGKTLVKENDTLFAYPHDIKKWVYFIFRKYNG
jgi:hypothetical protein